MAFFSFVGDAGDMIGEIRGGFVGRYLRCAWDLCGRLTRVIVEEGGGSLTFDEEEEGPLAVAAGIVDGSVGVSFVGR